MIGPSSPSSLAWGVTGVVRGHQARHAATRIVALVWRQRAQALAPDRLGPALDPALALRIVRCGHVGHPAQPHDRPAIARQDLRPAEGWRANHRRVERSWRQKGLKVPKRQPQQGRLWLSDGSCLRLRPE